MGRITVIEKGVSGRCSDHAKKSIPPDYSRISGGPLPLWLFPLAFFAGIAFTYIVNFIHYIYYGTKQYSLWMHLVSDFSKALPFLIAFIALAAIIVLSKYFLTKIATDKTVHVKIQTAKKEAEEIIQAARETRVLPRFAQNYNTFV